MNLNLQEGIALAKELNDALKADKPNCDVIICTPFIHLASVANVLDAQLVGLGAENCADKEKGAFTGEVSAEMVKSTGAQYVILGHSERREYYKETPEILKEKVLLALKNGLKVIFCIGETLAEREANKQNEVVKAELEGSVFNLSEDEFKNIVIAYEPIWAIGTGKTATAEQAEEIHAYIRSIVAEKYGQAVADNTSILYGGSCKASNAPGHRRWSHRRCFAEVRRLQGHHRCLEEVIMRRLILFFTLCAGIVVNASAQTFTQRVQQKKAGQGTVTIEESAEIDQLVNSAVLGATTTTTKPTTPTSPTSPTKPTNPTSSTTTTKPTTTTDNGTTAEEAPVEITKKIRTGGTKVTGYRVQAFAGGNSRKDRIQAESVASRIKGSYPEVPVYTHFISPRWICRVGNYRTYEEAHQMLLSLRKMGFTEAVIVKGKITVYD